MGNCQSVDEPEDLTGLERPGSSAAMGNCVQAPDPAEAVQPAPGQPAMGNCVQAPDPAEAVQPAPGQFGSLSCLPCRQLETVVAFAHRSGRPDYSLDYPAIVQWRCRSAHQRSIEQTQMTVAAALFGDLGHANVGTRFARGGTPSAEELAGRLGWAGTWASLALQSRRDEWQRLGRWLAREVVKPEAAEEFLRTRPTAGYLAGCFPPAFVRLASSCKALRGLCVEIWPELAGVSGHTREDAMQLILCATDCSHPALRDLHRHIEVARTMTARIGTIDQIRVLAWEDGPGGFYTDHERKERLSQRIGDHLATVSLLLDSGSHRDRLVLAEMYAAWRRYLMRELWRYTDYAHDSTPVLLAQLTEGSIPVSFTEAFANHYFEVTEVDPVQAFANIEDSSMSRYLNRDSFNGTMTREAAAAVASSGLPTGAEARGGPLTSGGAVSRMLASMLDCAGDDCKDEWCTVWMSGHRGRTGGYATAVYRQWMVAPDGKFAYVECCNEESY